MFLALTFGVVGVRADTLQSTIDDAEEDAVIQLDADYTEDIIIGENQKVTLDLNGHTLTTWLKIDSGDLTVKDTAGGGKLVNRKFNLEVSNGSFTLNSGTIESKNDYAIYGLNDSLITINGGTISTVGGDYACLGSNNTTGDATFVINGGTLDSKWQAIYLASPVGITINGGTINGGIALRMGKINITGGTINAAV